jgi:hypothetical protein
MGQTRSIATLCGGRSNHNRRCSSLDASVATKFKTLGAALFEVAANVRAVFIDGARVHVIGGAMEDAATMLTGLECSEPEMAFL